METIIVNGETIKVTIRTHFHFCHAYELAHGENNKVYAMYKKRWVECN